MSHVARISLKFASRQLIMQCDKLLLFFSYISTPKGQQITQKISVKIIKYLSFGDGKLKLKKKNHSGNIMNLRTGLFLTSVSNLLLFYSAPIFRFPVGWCAFHHIMFLFVLRNKENCICFVWLIDQITNFKWKTPFSLGRNICNLRNIWIFLLFPNYKDK